MIADRIHPLTGQPRKTNGHARRDLFELRAEHLPRRREIRATYDAARTTDEFKNYWANADALDADSANSKAVRATLVQRSRYEVGNNGFAGGSLDICADFRSTVLEANANGLVLIEASDAIEDGIYAGRYGTAEWDEFTFEKAEPECDNRCPGTSGTTPCEDCETGNMSLEFLLTGDWYSSPEQEGACGDLPSCNDLGALLLAAGFDPTTDCLGCAAGATLAMCPIMGTGTGASVVACITAGRVEVLYWLEGNAGFADSFIKYRKDFDGPFNCLEFDDEPIPFHSLTDLNGFPGNTEACGPVPDFVFLTSL